MRELDGCFREVVWHLGEVVHGGDEWAQVLHDNADLCSSAWQWDSLCA